MPSGFYIRELCIKGKGKTDASIKFEKGANVICGSSNSGKSFISEVIAYVFGRKANDWDFTEQMGYTNYFVEIGLFKSNTIYTIFRKRNDNSVIVKEASIQEFDKSKKESKHLQAANPAVRKSTISYFLLSLSGLEDKVLLKGKTKGDTQKLTFTTLFNFFAVNEVRIIDKPSPFYPSMTPMQRTAEQSILKILLGGKDYSDQKEVKNVKEEQTNLRGKIEYIADRIIKLSEERSRLLKERNEELIVGVEDDFSKLEKSLSESLIQLEGLNEQRQTVLANILKKEKEAAHFAELLARFRLLMKQYNSDLSRLTFIHESEGLSSQLGDVMCPICGSPFTEDEHTHTKEMENFTEALQVEAGKINSKIVDLQDAIDRREITLADSKADLQDLMVEEQSVEQSRSGLASKVASLRGRMQELFALGKIDNQLEFIISTIDELGKEKSIFSELLKTKKSTTAGTSIVPESMLKGLLKRIQDRLKTWNYEENPQVTFDSKTTVFDIIVSGKSRQSNGKGIRGLLYAACVLGLSDYCMEKGINNPNLVLLDSPLTALKGKGEVRDEVDNKGGNKVSDTVKRFFFKDLAKTSDRRQIIIFDNEIPKAPEKDLMNVIIFTGDGTIGRSGFMPF
jgi:DNA repair exonuclease SbcCD ATPase subunit